MEKGGDLGWWWLEIETKQPNSISNHTWDIEHRRLVSFWPSKPGHRHIYLPYIITWLSKLPPPRSKTYHPHRPSWPHLLSSTFTSNSGTPLLTQLKIHHILLPLDHLLPSLTICTPSRIPRLLHWVVFILSKVLQMSITELEPQPVPPIDQAGGEPKPPSDVDVLIIGAVRMHSLFVSTLGLQTRRSSYHAFLSNQNLLWFSPRARLAWWLRLA